MNHPAHCAIALLPQLAFNSDILAAYGSETLNERRVRVEFRVLKTRHEAVAALAHTTDFRTIEGEIELVLVRLCDAYV